MKWFTRIILVAVAIMLAFFAKNPLCPYTLYRILLNYGATVGWGIVEFSVNPTTLPGYIMNGVFGVGTGKEGAVAFFEKLGASVIGKNDYTTTLRLDLKNMSKDACGKDDPKSFRTTKG